MSSFTDALDDLDEQVMASLNDGLVDHLNASGAVTAAGIEAIVDTGIERFADVSGAVERVVTITVRKSLLGSIDRKGRFRAATPIPDLADKTWHIDGIEKDDGDLITFYVVP